MTTTEIITTLNALSANYGIKADTHLHIDAMDSPNANYVVCEIWKNGKIDIYLTDNDEKFIDNNCVDVRGLRQVSVWHTRNGVTVGSHVFQA